MGQSQNIRRFRINPIEVVIFSITLIVLGHSLYNLLYRQTDFTPRALTERRSTINSPHRSLASSTKSPLETLELSCDAESNLNASAERIRLKGRLCGMEKDATEVSDVKIQVTYHRPQATSDDDATVFVDLPHHQFNTDYIHLMPGRNPIRLEYKYAKNKVFSQELVIQY